MKPVMKKTRRVHPLNFRSVACLLLALAGCEQTTLTTVAAEELDVAQRLAAQKFGSETLRAWAKDTYPKVSVPADKEFRLRQNDKNRQRKADKSIEGKYGNFQSMTFYEAVRSNPPQFIAYRFKGVFSKSSEPLEVRVVYDTSGKLGGFWIKPWSDSIS